MDVNNPGAQTKGIAKVLWGKLVEETSVMHRGRLFQFPKWAMQIYSSENVKITAHIVTWEAVHLNPGALMVSVSFPLNKI